MRKEACEDCTSWEEELFWTHFQYIHFIQFLHAGFHQRLDIPEKFTRSLKRKLPDNVTLKSPGGTEWKVSLTTHENTLFFDHGWQDFAQEHALRESDILIFKYNGDSCFDVLMFDGQSLCEKTGSYFLTKCMHKQHNTTGCQIKRKNGESSAEVLSTSLDDGHGGSQQKKAASNDVCTPPFERPLFSQATTEKARREIKFDTAISAPVNATKRQIRYCPVDLDSKADDAKTVRKSHGLSSRSIRDRDVSKALQSARATVTPAGFLVVMQPTHVSGKFYMSIPTTWASKHIPTKANQYVILRVKEKTWQMRLYFRHRPVRAGLCGMKKFVLDNNITQFDACVFEPGVPIDNKMVLDVNIFYAVPDTIPPPPAPAVQTGEKITLSSAP